jgi:hypothetical protein
MKFDFRALRATSLVALTALALAACSGEPKDDEDEDEDTATTASAGGPPVAGIPGIVGDARLARPSAWFPSDWDDKTVAQTGTDQDKANFNVPLQLFALGNDDQLDEAFQPAWVWWTALRSCEKGAQLVEDLAGEFGDRARGAASLTAARKDIADWASKQPKQLTISFTANLGSWDAGSGMFPIGSVGPAMTVDPVKADEAVKGFRIVAGRASVQNSQDGSYISNVIAQDTHLQCPGKTEGTLQSINMQLSTQLHFGTPVTQYGQVRFVDPPKLPELKMDRDAAAAFAESNPERKVVVSVVVEARKPSFANYGSLSVPVALVKAAIRDSNGRVLAEKDYAASAAPQ